MSEFFWRKSEETSNFKVWVVGRSNQHRRVPILPADRSTGYLRLQGRCSTSAKNEPGQKKPVIALMTLPQVISKRCSRTELSRPTSVTNPCQEHHCICEALATALVRFKGLLLNAASVFNRRCPWHAKIWRHFLILA